SLIELGCYGTLIASNTVGQILHRDEKTIPMWILYVIQVLAFSILVFHSFNFDAAWINFFALTMALLGISNFAMLLGHYYLVVPKLSEEPLIYCLYIFWIVFFLK